ncbi:MAG: hypothetical protein MUC87_21620 [Bacteroidia bacterium]|jgi:hypothetical protein|nr:hypothetical protein [Bacteroidia bacterium]
MRALLLSVFLFSVAPLLAQTPNEQPVVSTNANTYDEIGALYRFQESGGIMVHSNGLGIHYQRGKFLTGYSKGFFEIQLANFRHPKEVKAENPGFDNSKGYFYGKLNSLFMLRPGVGYQKVIYTRPRQRGVEVSYVTFAGVSLGLLKPVYLIIARDVPNQIRYQPVTERYDPAQHFTDNIIGRAPFSRGLAELSVVPGVYGRAGLNFDFYNRVPEDQERGIEKVRTLETGICIDAYAKRMPLMANEQNKPVLLTVYLALSYGRKWI